MQEIINTRVMETKKGGRVWLHGAKLDRLNWSKGEKYSREIIDDNTVVLTLDELGDKKVSGKNGDGLIDMCGQWVNEIFGKDELITATIQVGKIRVERHYEAMKQREREERALNSPRLKEGSLCYGIGVSAHAVNKGLKESGIDTDISLIMEREPKYLHLAEKNNPTMKDCLLTVYGNIEECNPDILPNLDIMKISLPCTGHSNLGKAKNGNKYAEQHKSDATAVIGAIRVIGKTNPSVIISENVVQAKDSATYILFKEELKRTGYEIFEIILDESHSDALETRKRYWFVAMSKNIAKGFSLDSIEKYIPERKYNKIGDLLECTGHDFFSTQTFREREKKNKESGRSFKCNFVSDDSTFVGVIPRFYAKRQVSNPHYKLKDLEFVRLFSPVEHARIKGIPEELIKDAVKTTAHEGLGQSILYAHAYILARAVGDHLFSMRANLRLAA